jgi:hypothetical protein
MRQWWNASVTKCVSDKMRQWRNASVMECVSDGMRQWRNASVTKCVSDEMRQWWNASVMKCVSDEMRQWRNASVMKCVSDEMRQWWNASVFFHVLFYFSFRSLRAIRREKHSEKRKISKYQLNGKIVLFGAVISIDRSSIMFNNNMFHLIRTFITRKFSEDRRNIRKFFSLETPEGAVLPYWETVGASSRKTEGYYLSREL